MSLCHCVSCAVALGVEVVWSTCRYVHRHNKQATRHNGWLNQPFVFSTCVHASAEAAVLRLSCRYKKAADWTLLSDLVQDNPTLALIGNGDILTHYEAADR